MMTKLFTLAFLLASVAFAQPGSTNYNGSLTPFVNLQGSSTGYYHITSGLTGSINYNIAFPATTANDAVCLELLGNCGAGFTLTTTGTSGAATYTGGVLNIPNYTAGSAPTWE